MRFLNLLIYTLIIYSLIPYTFSIPFTKKILGVPFSYIPIFVIFLCLFIFYVLFKKEIYLKEAFFIFLVFIGYLIILIFIFLLKKQLYIKDYCLDLVMYVFYGFVVFYGTFLYFYNSHFNLEYFIYKFLKALYLICIISFLKFFFLDKNQSPFFNLFNPLRYRFFEVLFLSFFASLALGWYYSTNDKKYFLFFIVFILALLLVGSRTGYISLVLLFIFFLIKERKKFFMPSRIIIYILLIITVLFLNKF